MRFFRPGSWSVQILISTVPYKFTIFWVRISIKGLRIRNLTFLIVEKRFLKFEKPIKHYYFRLLCVFPLRMWFGKTGPRFSVCAIKQYVGSGSGPWYGSGRIRNYLQYPDPQLEFQIRIRKGSGIQFYTKNKFLN